MAPRDPLAPRDGSCVAAQNAQGRELHILQDNNVVHVLKRDRCAIDVFGGCVVELVLERRSATAAQPLTDVFDVEHGATHSHQLQKGRLNR